MTNVLIIGYSAAFLSMIAFFPTLYDIFQKKTAQHISLYSTLLLLTSFILWVIYGVRLESWPLVVQCAFSGFIQLLILLAIFFTFKKKI